VLLDLKRPEARAAHAGSNGRCRAFFPGVLLPPAITPNRTIGGSVCSGPLG